MVKIRYENTLSADDIVFGVEDNLVDECIAAEIESAKLDLRKLGYSEFKVYEFINTDGNWYKELYCFDADGYVRWTVMKYDVNEC